MIRRNFLKLLGMTAVGVAAPKLIVGDVPVECKNIIIRGVDFSTGKMVVGRPFLYYIDNKSMSFGRLSTHTTLLYGAPVPECNNTMLTPAHIEAIKASLSH